MKKISISLFGLLAIVFAIGSAFTTSSKKVISHEIFAVPISNAVTYNSTPSLIDEDLVAAGIPDPAGNWAGFGSQTALQYVTANDDQFLCSDEELDIVCVAVVEFDGTDALQVRSAVAGGYTEL